MSAPLGSGRRIWGGGLIGLIVVLGLTLILDPGHDILASSRVTPYLSLGARAVAPVLPQDIREALLERLDRLVTSRRYANRSEAIRDLIRRRMVEDGIEDGAGEAGSRPKMRNNSSDQVTRSRSTSHCQLPIVATPNDAK